MCEKGTNERYLQNNTVLRKETTPMTLTELFPFEPAEVPFPSLLFISHCKYNDFLTNNIVFQCCKEQREKSVLSLQCAIIQMVFINPCKEKAGFSDTKYSHNFCLLFVVLGRLACKCCHPACWYLVGSTLQEQGPFTGATWVASPSYKEVWLLVSYWQCTDHLLEHCRATRVGEW